MSPVALPSILSDSLLTSIRNNVRIPKDTWYLITATVLTILNRADEIQKVYEHAIKFGGSHIQCEPDSEEKLKITRRIREALIKASVVGGMPKVSV